MRTDINIDAAFCSLCGTELVKDGNDTKCPRCDCDEEVILPAEQALAFTSTEETPLSIKQWSWGAFFWGPFWACTLKMWDIGIGLFVLCVIWLTAADESWLQALSLLLVIVLAFYLGARGNEIACKRHAFRDIKHFLVFRRKWNLAAWVAVAYIIYAYWPWLSGQRPVSEFFS